MFVEHLLCARHFSQLLVYLGAQNDDLDTLRVYILDENADNKHKHNKKANYIAC